MARLEDLTRDASVKGILPNGLVTVIDVKWIGTVAVELTYKDAAGILGSDLLYRDREATLEIAVSGRPWSFDGDGALFRLVSEAQRIRLAHLFDPLLAVHTSLVGPLPHQITAVYGEMLPRQPLRFLLADDPGAGKTIMTGLFIKELQARGDLQRCLIVCPGNLADQWQDELDRRFHLPFEILTNDALEAARTGNWFFENPLAICRLDKLSRNEDVQAKLRQTDWDLIVCDEAHKMSATYFGSEVKYTKRYRLGQALSALTRHFLLLTATPHNGKEADFQLFMTLLDGDRFEGKFRDGVHAADTSDLMRRLVKEQLLKFDGTPLFPERIAYTVNYKLSDAEAELYKQVTDYVREEFNRADALANGGQKGTVGFALTILQRRLASSPEAIFQSLRRRKERLQKRLREEQLNKRVATVAVDLIAGLPTYDDDALDDLDDAPDAEVEEAEERVVDQASAARTIAERTIYLGSAPMQRAANRGLDERRVKLGCVQPGETVATFGDALRRLTDAATYLYVDGKRYWYSTVPTVTRLAEDRASQLSEHDVDDEIHKRLREQARSRADFAKVHACVSSGDVPDEREARLVILGTEHPHAAKDAKSPARTEAGAILDTRGNSPRNYKNSLVYLAPDSTRLKELRQAARQFLAWSSIMADGSGENSPLNLDNFQKRQADTKLKHADETVDARIPETFQWLLVPGQPDPKGNVEWTEIRLQGQDTLAVRAAKKLKHESLLISQFGGVNLRLELDRVPLWRGNHVGVKQLAEDVTRYLYLPRLRDEDVLVAAIRDGLGHLTWQAETFAYAEGWDEARARYLGLRAGQNARVLVDGLSLLVRPEAAAAQLQAEAAQAAATMTTTAHTDPGAPTPLEMTTGPVAGTNTGTGPAPPAQLTRFHGAVKLDPLRLGRDATQIAAEIVQHLTRIVGAQVEISLEIQADLLEGASDKLVRDVTENCRTLRFDQYGFEEA